MHIFTQGWISCHLEFRIVSQLCWIICLFVASFVYYAASLRSYLAIITHEIMPGQFCLSNLLFYHIYLNIYKLLYGNINSFHHSIPHSNPYSIPKIRDTRVNVVYISVSGVASPSLMPGQTVGSLTHLQ